MNRRWILALGLLAPFAARAGPFEKPAVEPDLPPPLVLDDDVLAQWTAELVPKIESIAMRSFVDVPVVQLSTQEYVQERHLRLVRGLREKAEVAVDPDLDSIHAGGMYLLLTQEIFIFRDLVRIVGSPALPDGFLGTDLFRCYLAHELVHSLHHQYGGGRVGDRALAPSTLALAEGFSDLIGAESCGAAKAAEALDAAAGMDAPASFVCAQGPQLSYGVAENFLRKVREIGGIEGVWRSLAEPPSLQSICDVGRALEPKGWDDPMALEPALRTVFPKKGFELINRAGSLAETAPAVAEDRQQASRAWRTVGGLAYGEGFLVDFAMVFVYLMRDEDAPVRWMAARGRAFRFGGTIPLIGVREGTTYYLDPEVYQMPFIARALGGTFGMRIFVHLRDAGEYRERWVAKGRYLYGIVRSGPDVNRALVTRALRALVNLPLSAEAVPLSAELAERAMPAAATTVTNATVAASFRIDQLYPSLSRGAWAQCVERGLDFLSDTADEDLARLVLTCAGRLGDAPSSARTLSAVCRAVSLPTCAGIPTTSR